MRRFKKLKSPASKLQRANIGEKNINDCPALTINFNGSLWAIVYVFFASQSRLFNLQSIKELAAAATALQAPHFIFFGGFAFNQKNKNLSTLLPQACCKVKRTAIKISPIFGGNLGSVGGTACDV